MNAGLSNLTVLKAFLLPGVIRPESEYDAAITALGLGMAGAMESHCNRSWGRVVASQLTLQAGDRMVFTLPNYPVESITSIELRDRVDGYWETQTLADFAMVDLEAGIIHCYRPPGTFGAQIRVTWTGGYWWETAEPEDDGYPTTQPELSYALPAALQTAWLLQCAEAWSRRDNLGVGITQAPQARAQLSALDWLPQVQNVLKAYIRHG